jgi:hypothetical protein
MKVCTLKALHRSLPTLDKMISDLCEMQMIENNKNAVLLNEAIDRVEAARVCVLSLLQKPVLVDSNGIQVVVLHP